MGAKTESKTEPETGPLKKARPSEKNNPVLQKGFEMGAQKGVPCETLACFMLHYCFLLDFGTFRAYFRK